MAVRDPVRGTPGGKRGVRDPGRGVNHAPPVSPDKDKECTTRVRDPGKKM